MGSKEDFSRKKAKKTQKWKPSATDVFCEIFAPPCG
jgi:hypothetical protein